MWLFFISNFRQIVQPFLNEDDVSINVIVNIDDEADVISGTITATREDAGFCVNIKGDFPHDDYMVFTYQSKNDEIKQFGGGVLNLLPNANVMEGHYSGFGHTSQKMLQGRVSLKRSKY